MNQIAKKVKENSVKRFFTPDHYYDSLDDINKTLTTIRLTVTDNHNGSVTDLGEISVVVFN